MTEPTLKPREPAAQEPTEPRAGTPAGGARPTGEGHPDARDGDVREELRQLRTELERTSKRLSDKDRFIGDLQSQVQALKERAQPASPQGDPDAEQFNEALHNLDAKRMLDMVRTGSRKEIEAAMQRTIPAALAAERRRADVQRRLDEMRAAGLDPEQVRPDKAYERLQTDPLGAYVGGLIAEGKEDEAMNLLDGRKKQRDVERKKAEISQLIAEGRPEGRARLAAMLNTSPSGGGQSADYAEGESPIFMLEMGRAPHARVVKDNNLWRSDD